MYYLCFYVFIWIIGATLIPIYTYLYFHYYIKSPVSHFVFLTQSVADITAFSQSLVLLFLLVLFAVIMTYFITAYFFYLPKSFSFYSQFVLIN